jgi:hypothetical protein
MVADKGNKLAQFDWDNGIVDEFYRGSDNHAVCSYIG